MIQQIWCKIRQLEESGIGGGIESIQPGENITINNTDPKNPIVSSTGGGDITTDSTLKGNGTSESPLGLSTSKNNEIAGKLDKNQTGSQTVQGDVNFNKKISVGGWYHQADTTKHIYSSGNGNFKNNNFGNVSADAYAIGDNLFPKFELNTEEAEVYTSRFLGFGSNIFTNYLGSVQYRPEHPAHDSWVGVGFNLGAGFEDGTNVTIVGTANMHRNDTKLADSVTIIGKGNTTGVPAGGDPNRVVRSVSGVDVHQMMGDVIMVGHENWLGDIRNSTIVGSACRVWRYVFNSLVLGQGHLNFNWEGSVEQGQAFLDSDVIIGMGQYKDLRRHNASHNLIVGMDYNWATHPDGPDQGYRPLIEGDFRKESADFQVNGHVIAGHSQAKDDLPEYTPIQLSAVAPVPEGATITYEGETNSVVIGEGAPTSGMLKLTPFEIGSVYYVQITPIEVLSGSYGGHIGSYADSGNPNTSFTWKVPYAPEAGMSTDLDITWEGNFKGTLEVQVFKINTNGYGSKPSFSLKSGDEQVTMEIRSGSSLCNHIIFGKGSGKFLFSGTPSIIFGQNTYTKAVSSNNSVIVGNNNSINSPRTTEDVLIGNDILRRATQGSTNSVLVGSNIANKAMTDKLETSVIVGAYASPSIKKSVGSVGIGAASNFLTEISERSVTVGASSGNYKTLRDSVIIGYLAGSNYPSSELENVILIGSDVNSEGGNNTVTIGGVKNTANYFRGTVIADSFQIRGSNNVVTNLPLEAVTNDTNSPLSLANLNSTYQNVPLGFEVICNGIGKVYKKTGQNHWSSITIEVIIDIPE